MKNIDTQSMKSNNRDLSTIPNFKKVDNRYLLKNQLLGKGSFAETFLATYINDQSQVMACKMINKKSIVNKLKGQDNIEDKLLQIIDQLKTEIKLWKTLDNPYCIKFYDIQETGSNLYIFLEFCDSHDLETVLKKGTFKLQQIIEVIRQIINGCKYLYDKNIFHRDLKPENILIHNEKAKITDFGFAKLIEEDKKDLAINNQSLGSPYYMAPQVLQREGYSIKCDVWSLGVMFYRMLYNKMPWENIKNINELIKAIHTQQIEYPNTIPLQLIKLLQSMLVISEKYRLSITECKEIMDKIPSDDPSILKAISQDFTQQDQQQSVLSQISTNQNNQVSNPTNEPNHANSVLSTYSGNNANNTSNQQKIPHKSIPQENIQAKNIYQLEQNKINSQSIDIQQQQQQNNKINDLPIDEENANININIPKDYNNNGADISNLPYHVKKQQQLQINKVSRENQDFNYKVEEESPHPQNIYSSTNNHFNNNINLKKQQQQQLQQQQQYQDYCNMNPSQQQQFKYIPINMKNMQNNQEFNNNEYPEMPNKSEYNMSQFSNVQFQYQQKQEEFYPNHLTQSPLLPNQNYEMGISNNFQYNGNMSQYNKNNNQVANSDKQKIQELQQQLDQYKKMLQSQTQGKQMFGMMQTSEMNPILMSEMNMTGSQNFGGINKNLTNSQNQMQYYNLTNSHNQMQFFQQQQQNLSRSQNQFMNQNNLQSSQNQMQFNNNQNNLQLQSSINQPASNFQKSYYQSEFLAQQSQNQNGNNQNKQNLQKSEVSFNEVSFCPTQNQMQINQNNEKSTLKNNNNTQGSQYNFEKLQASQIKQEKLQNSSMINNSTMMQSNISQQIKNSSIFSINSKKIQKPIKNSYNNLPSYTSLKQQNNQKLQDLQDMPQKKSSQWQQSRHKNIWTNFGKALKKTFQGHSKFLIELNNNIQQEFPSHDKNGQSNLINEFNDYVENQLKFNRKIDFKLGWTLYQDDSDKIKSFKRILRKLSKLFFQDYAMQYLLNSRMKDINVHIRAIPRMISSLNNPKLLVPEGGIFRGI